MFVLDYKDSRPIYEQIAEKFKNLILCGAMTENDKMPSVRTMAMELSINPNTIQKAYAELERQGYIYTVKGRGNFVAASAALLQEKRQECMHRLLALAREAADYGITIEEIIHALKGEKGENFND